MPQSQLEVCNRALIKIGARTTLSSVSVSGDSQEERVCANSVDLIKKSLLAVHPWNFATKRKILTPYQNVAVSNVTYVSSGLIEVTAATTGLVAGDYCTLTGVVGATGANGTFEVASVPTVSTVVRLTAPDITSSALLGTYTASDVDYIRRSPAFDYTYLYALPSDLIKVLNINPRESGAEWKIEGKKVLSDDSTLDLKYVYDVTDYTEMSIFFYESMSYALALDISREIGNDESLRAALVREFKDYVKKARFDDSVEDSVQALVVDDWVNSRNSNIATGSNIFTIR